MAKRRTKSESESEETSQDTGENSGAKKATNAEVEERITVVYSLLMQQASYREILRYATKEWKVKPRMTDIYIARAKKIVDEEAARSRTQIFNEQIAVRRNLFRQAYRDRKWETCLNILKDQCQLLRIYPSKIEIVEAAKVFMEEGLIDGGDLEKLEVQFSEFKDKISQILDKKTRAEET